MHFTDEDGEPVRDAALPVALALDEGVEATGRVLAYRRGKRPRRWVSCTTRLLPGPGEGSGGCVLTITDITAARETATTLSQLARFDQLTGLANRRLCLERLSSSVARVRRGGTPASVSSSSTSTTSRT